MSVFLKNNLGELITKNTCSPLCSNYIFSKWISHDFEEMPLMRTEESKRVDSTFIADHIAQIELVQQFQNSFSKSQSLSLSRNEQDLLKRALRGYCLDIKHLFDLTSLNGYVQGCTCLLTRHLSYVAKRMDLFYKDSQMTENGHNLTFWKEESRRARCIISYIEKTMQSSKEISPSMR